MQQDRTSEPDFPEELSDELNAFARQLRTGFQPSPAILDHGQLMFEAGRTAALAEFGRRETPEARLPSVRVLRLWQTAATLMTAVSLTLATTLTLSTNPEPHVVIVDRVASPATTPVSNKSAPAVEPVQNRRTPSAPAPLARNRSTTKRFPPSDDLSEFFTAESSGIFLQRIHELALAPSPNPRSNTPETAATNVGALGHQPATEPPLRPLSLIGRNPHLSINRFLEEHSL